MNLVAIGASRKSFVLGGASVLVSGLSLRKLTELLVAYPDLGNFVAGGKVEMGTVVAIVPDAALAVFSLGVVGRAPSRWWQPPPADEDFTEAFEQAPAGQQIEILGAIYDITFKGSERAIPFLKMILAPGPEPKPELKSEPISESVSVAASEPAATPETSGASTQVSSNG